MISSIAAFVLLENLDRTFLRNLLHALHELLALHRIHLPHSRKMLRCERRDSLEFERLRRGECISDGKIPGSNTPMMSPAYASSTI